MVELHPESRKLLEVARDLRTPTAADRERVFASLMASVAVTSVAPAAAAKTGLAGKFAGSALWIKAAASVAVLSAASVSTFVYVQHRARSAVTHSAAPSITAVAPAAIHSSEPAIPPPAAGELSPASAKEERAQASPRHAAHVEEKSLELGMLRQARDARRAGQPQRALELTKELAEKYPRSKHWAERETLRVLALCDLGRVDAARRSAASLQYLWSSPLRATLNASCVGK
ncbi:MAG TPA: hypothetical protein VGM44_19715 [Polyangiaceae bacterium]